MGIVTTMKPMQDNVEIVTACGHEQGGDSGCVIDGVPLGLDINTILLFLRRKIKSLGTLGECHTADRRCFKPGESGRVTLAQRP